MFKPELKPQPLKKESERREVKKEKEIFPPEIAFKVDLEVMKRFNLRTEQEKIEWINHYGKPLRELLDDNVDMMLEMYKNNPEELYSDIVEILKGLVEASA